MRHAIALSGGLWMGMDNSSGIGEKPQDVVHAPNQLVAYMAARVALLELWSAGAEPHTILLTNFTGDAAWIAYEQGIQQIFQDMNMPTPPIAGSTESNMETLQSGIVIQMIGRITRNTKACGNWYLIGSPLVGEAVIEHSAEVVSLRELHQARQSGIITSLHPSGSGGVAKEIERLGLITSSDIPKGSAGPSTCVLVTSFLEKDALQREFEARVLKV